jgi:hypothetical protein
MDNRMASSSNRIEEKNRGCFFHKEEKKEEDFFVFLLFATGVLVTLCFASSADLAITIQYRLID